MSNLDYFSEFPLAYHITFGTYGTRLHGDERGTVDRRMNHPGEPIIGSNDQWGLMERRLLKCEPVLFSLEQRLAIEHAAPGICERENGNCMPSPRHLIMCMSCLVQT